MQHKWLSDTPEYQVWRDMKSRCLNPKSHAWQHYGGRGITVCERWKQFKNFLQDMGARPEETELDRIDNNKGYSPDNCRWATKQQNCANTRRTNRLTHCGQTLSISEWARKVGLSRNTLKSRLRYGWKLERALTEGVTKW